MDEYPTPAQAQTFELEIKRSRFVTSVVPVEGRETARIAAALEPLLQMMGATWEE